VRFGSDRTTQVQKWHVSTSLKCPTQVVRNAYKILIWKPEWKRTLGRPRCRWQDNITTGVEETWCDNVEWTEHWLSTGSSCCFLWIKQWTFGFIKGGEFFTSWETISVFSMELIQVVVHTPSDCKCNPDKDTSGRHNESSPQNWLWCLAYVASAVHVATEYLGLASWSTG
jgi:hypothetical protein